MVRLGMENLWPEANPVAQGQKGGSNVKFNEFMGKTRSGELPHVFLLAGEEHYYLDKARERILGRLFPEGGQQDGLEKLKGEVSPVTLAGMLEEVPFFTPRQKFPPPITMPTCRPSAMQLFTARTTDATKSKS